MLRLVGLLGVVCFALPAWGQVIYQPVQYQYGTRWGYYYGGNDPRVFKEGERLQCLAVINEYQEATPLPVQIYTDCIPGWNAALYRYTPNDARNEAYANVPRYFSKRDLRKGEIVIVPYR